MNVARVLAVILATGCSGKSIVGVDYAISNGVSWMPGTDPNATTSLAGSCDIVPDIGQITCGGLTIRLNTPGIWQGLGWELRDQSSPTCAGSMVAAPRVSIFSFGTLSIEPGAMVSVRSTKSQVAVALVAAHAIDVQGLIGASRSDGGSDAAFASFSTASPGGWSSAQTSGAGGAGGATAGGAGGNAGGAGGPSLPTQFEPMCFGSTGGTVGTVKPNNMGGTFEAIGGTGGGVIMLAAKEKVAFKGSVGSDCGVLADGSDGATNSTSAGAGGGSGGVIMIEAPQVTLDPLCRFSAKGGNGGFAGGFPGSGPDGGSPGGASGGGVGGGIDAPQNGVDGSLAGGGGGGAGFIRVRATQCQSSYGATSPQPTCLLMQ